jgi:hydroxyacylglutathione hydrolase
MKIERFEVAGLAQYSYVISDGGEAVVVDAIRDVERYVAYAKTMGLKIVGILETHIHADFAAGSVALAEVTGAELLLSAYDEGERFVYAMPHRALKEGDEVRVGKVRLRVMHTPGHTPEHVSFLLYKDGGKEPVAMFSGDFLFVGSLGRPDLLGEEAKVALAHSLYGSVQRMKGLPNGLKIYPGHGAGSFCGAGMGVAPETMLGAERVMNPFFKLGEEEFVAEILGASPEMPSYYPRMKALNAAGARALDVAKGSKAISAEEIGNAVLLDLRGMDAYAAEHIRGSVSMGAGPSLSLWAGWLLDAERPIVLVTEDGGDDAVSRWALARVGLDNVVGHLEGGMEVWTAQGRKVARTGMKTVEQLRRELGAVLVLDVRNDAERRHGSVPGSMHVKLGELPRVAGEIPRDREVVTVCQSGYRASVAASLLERAGVERVGSLAGGMGAWESSE